MITLQYVKAEGEGLGDFITRTTSMSTWIGKMGEGSPTEKNECEAFFGSICPSAGVMNVHKAKNLLFTFQNEEHVL